MIASKISPRDSHDLPKHIRFKTVPEDDETDVLFVNFKSSSFVCQGTRKLSAVPTYPELIFLQRKVP
jgi:hypothetical protein